LPGLKRGSESFRLRQIELCTAAQGRYSSIFRGMDDRPTQDPAPQTPHAESSTDSPPRLDRRTFIGTLGAGLAVGYGAKAATRFPADAKTPPLPPQRRPSPSRPRAQNVIFMVSDGMSIGAMQLADLRIAQTRNRRSHWVSLIEHDKQIRRAVVETSSFNSLVTDSAAAATAWGLGELAENGRIGMLPDGRQLSPFMLRAREAGKATGLITTTRLTHATPAGVSCNIFGGNRNDEDRISRQLIERGYDLLLGGGGRHFDPFLEWISNSDVVRTNDQLRFISESNTATPFDRRKRLLGLFSDSHMSYELDRDAQQPSLAEMTRVGLNWLSKAPGGFAVQIEGGRVDHAAHSNDAASLIADQVAFDDAIGIALEFARSRDDTLLVLTTDHATANPGLTDYTRMGIEGFALLEGVTQSFEWINRELDGTTANDADQIHATIQQATSLSISKRDLELIMRWRSGEAVEPFLLANRNSGPLGSVLANHTKVAFLSPNHTADFVELTALGPGSEFFGTTTRPDLTHDAICRAMDLPRSTPLNA